MKREAIAELVRTRLEKLDEWVTPWYRVSTVVSSDGCVTDVSYSRPSNDIVIILRSVLLFNHQTKTPTCLWKIDIPPTDIETALDFLILCEALQRQIDKELQGIRFEV